MGVCLSKGGHRHGEPVSNGEDGFCTPEGVSSQYGSPNPSGRYCFANLETPRESAEVGDFGALGSLFYKMGSRSRGTASNYIVPLDMFLGGLSGRNRVHHVNQICSGDYSMASYLASPLLKGFDVHAMEAVAKSYAESAAKAAARDAFVFLEENDILLSSETGGFPDEVVAAEGSKGLADGLTESGDLVEWEQPRKSENWDEAEDSFKSASSQMSDKSELWEEQKQTTNNIDEAKRTHHSASFSEKEEDTNGGRSDRWVSVLNAVEARANARRRQRRKSSIAKGQGAKDSCSKKKTVRFQVACYEEGSTNDVVESRKETKCEEALEIAAEGSFGSCEGTSSGLDHRKDWERRKIFYDREAVSERCYSLSLQDGVVTEGEVVKGPSSRDEGILEDDVTLEEEFVGFGTGDTMSDGLTPPVVLPSSEGVPSNIRCCFRESVSSDVVAPLAAPSSEQVSQSIPRCSLESVSAVEGRLMGEICFGPSHEEKAVDLFAVHDVEEDDDVRMSGSRLLAEESSREHKAAVAGNVRGDSDEDGHVMQSYPVNDPFIWGATQYLGKSVSMQQPPSLFDKDVGVNYGALPAIPVGCVVVESRMADGSRLTPLTLELREEELPERGQKRFGFFHARLLCSRDGSPSSLDSNSGQEGSFSFPILAPSSPSPERSPFSESSGLWRNALFADAENPSTNHSSTRHQRSSTDDVSRIHEIASSTDRFSDGTTCNARYSFSFDVEQTVTERTYDIVLPTLPARAVSSLPVFSPTKLPTSLDSLSLSSVEASYVPDRPRSGRSFSKKLKFYSLERASCAAGSKISKPPTGSFRRGRRRHSSHSQGASDSDFLKSQTMSGTNSMGSSRTPPSTPTKIIKMIPVPSFEFEGLSNSMSRSRLKRNISTKSVPLAPFRDTRLPAELRDNDLEEVGTRALSQNCLAGGAFLKLGLRRSSKHYASKDQIREEEFYRSSENSGSEYLENKPPSQGSRYHGQRGQCMIGDDSQNYAFEWYCTPMAQRQLGFSSVKSQHQRSDILRENLK